MKPAHLKQLIAGKQAWTEPLAPKAAAQGFKGWYASGHLPHFDAPGTRQFITYRLADALPASRRHEWEAFIALEDVQEKQRKIEAYLDKGYGACHLRDPRIANLVQENFWHHDGVKYCLLAWVIMPNHVHVLFETWHLPMGVVVKDWKSYTARAANKLLKRSGAFWEDHYFDVYLRDDEHYRRVVRYLENNPTKAHLSKAPEAWAWSSARFRGQPGPVVPELTHPTAKRSSPPQS